MIGKVDNAMRPLVHAIKHFAEQQQRGHSDELHVVEEGPDWVKVHQSYYGGDYIIRVYEYNDVVDRGASRG